MNSYEYSMKFIVWHLHTDCYLDTLGMSIMVPTVNLCYCSMQFPIKHLNSDCNLHSSINKCMDDIWRIDYWRDLPNTLVSSTLSQVRDPAPTVADVDVD